MANYDQERDRLTIDQSERNRLLSEFLQMMATQSTAQANQARDSATRAGASQGAKNALESGMAYSGGQAAEQGYNNLNRNIDDTNRRANEFIQQLIEQDKNRKMQLWGGIGSGLGSLAGYALAGPLGGLAANAITKPAANTIAGAKPPSSFDINPSPGFKSNFSDYSAETWYSKGNNNKTADFKSDYPMPRRF